MPPRSLNTALQRHRSRPAAWAGLVAFLDRLRFPNAVSATSQVPASFLVIMSAAAAPNVNCRLAVGKSSSFFGNSPSKGPAWIKTSGGLARAFVLAEDIADEKPDDNSPDSPWKMFHHDSLAFLLLPPSLVQETFQHTTPTLMFFRKVVKPSFFRGSDARRHPLSVHNHYSTAALRINRNQMDGRSTGGRAAIPASRRSPRHHLRYRMNQDERR